MDTDTPQPDYSKFDAWWRELDRIYKKGNGSTVIEAAADLLFKQGHSPQQAV